MLFPVFCAAMPRPLLVLPRYPLHPFLTISTTQTPFSEAYPDYFEYMLRLSFNSPGPGQRPFECWGCSSCVKSAPTFTAHTRPLVLFYYDATCAIIIHDTSLNLNAANSLALREPRPIFDPKAITWQLCGRVKAIQYLSASFGRRHFLRCCT